jgi:hypothetical protein
MVSMLVGNHPGCTIHPTVPSMACYPLAHHDIADSTTRDPRPQRVQPHFMQNNSYLAKKCDAVDRILNCGFDLVYVTVNAMVYLTLYNKNYTNSALGFRGSSPLRLSSSHLHLGTMVLQFFAVEQS